MVNHSNIYLNTGDIYSSVAQVQGPEFDSQKKKKIYVTIYRSIKLNSGKHGGGREGELDLRSKRKLVVFNKSNRKKQQGLSQPTYTPLVFALKQTPVLSAPTFRCRHLWKPDPPNLSPATKCRPCPSFLRLDFSRDLSPALTLSQPVSMAVSHPLTVVGDTSVLVGLCSAGPTRSTPSKMVLD